MPRFPFKEAIQGAVCLDVAARVLFSNEKEKVVKQNHQKSILMLFVLFAACSAKATPTSMPETPLTEQPVQPTEILQYHPLDTLTNIPDIDVIIKAVAAGDAQELRNVFEYTTIACRTVNALGGPPPCREAEAEGTPVEVLPSRGPEGSFLRKDEAENFPALDVRGLYAVYRVPDSAVSSENYPNGDYGIVYLTDANIPEVDLQVKNGMIVRIDYIFGYPESNTLLPEGVTDFVLQSLSK